jgi:hypothetical protein
MFPMLFFENRIDESEREEKQTKQNKTSNPSKIPIL